jgi:hypothetical protein
MLLLDMALLLAFTVGLVAMLVLAEIAVLHAAGFASWWRGFEFRWQLVCGVLALFLILVAQGEILI